MSSDLGDSLYINLPTIDADWIEEHAVEFWVGGVARFRAIDPTSWGDAFEKHFCGLREERPARFNAISDMCDAIAVSAVADIANKHIENADLWGASIATADEIETYNETIKAIFHAVAAEIADAWADHFGIEI